MVLAWVPADADRTVLDPLPPGVRVTPFPIEGDLPAEAEEVGFVVPPFSPRRRVLPTLGRLPRLQVVQTLSAGVDWLLPHVPPGVTLCDASGVHDASVAEWVVGAVLAMAKRLPDFLDAQRRGTWEQAPVADVEGKVVLILGHGSIGRAVEARLAPFGAHVRRVARRARPGVATLEEVRAGLGDVDVVVVLVPLTEATRGLVDAGLLASLPDGALVVNAARGPVVDTEALLGELRSGRLRAVLDVTDPEPLPAGHPLWSAPGLLITPHVAGVTPALPRRAYALVRAQLGRWAAGEPLANVVTDGY